MTMEFIMSSPGTCPAMQSNAKRQDVSQVLQHILDNLWIPLPAYTEDVSPAGGELPLELVNGKRFRFSYPCLLRNVSFLPRDNYLYFQQHDENTT